MASTIADLITTTILPALESQAASEAKKNFAGTYISTTPDLNYSLTISYDDTPEALGLYIASWISNSTDLVPLLPFLIGFPFKLQPSISQPGKKGVSC